MSIPILDADNRVYLGVRLAIHEWRIIENMAIKQDRSMSDVCADLVVAILAGKK